MIIMNKLLICVSLLIIVETANAQKVNYNLKSLLKFITTILCVKTIHLDRY